MATEGPILLVGNPNVGKSTLFNALTGLNAKVANYPGITVEAKVGRIKRFSGQDLTIVDLPGTYSLIPASNDEELTSRALLNDIDALKHPSLIVVVISASELRRGLYLYSQVIELGLKAIIAVTMVDLVENRLNKANLHILQRALGTHVIPVNVDDKASLSTLKNTFDGIMAKSLTPKIKEQPLLFIDLPKSLQEKLSNDEACRHELHENAQKSPDLISNHNIFLYSLKKRGLLEQSIGNLEALELNADDEALLDELIAKLPEERFFRVDTWLKDLGPRKERFKAVSDVIDKFLLHPFLGCAFALCLFGFTLQALFLLAEPLADYVEQGIGALGVWVSHLLPLGELTRSLVSEGIFQGIGSVLAFLPLIALLFCFLSILEDSGYLARTSVLLDSLLQKVGLCGRSLMPMLSGFACAVPAIMATRTIGGKKERLITILVTPFLTCSARLPVFALIVGALFSSYPPIFGIFDTGAFLFMAMYALGFVASILSAFCLAKILGDKQPASRLNIELPPYRFPRPSSVIKKVYDRVAVFIKDVGTLILASTILVWALFKLEVSPIHYPAEERASRPVTLEQTYAGAMGKTIEPLLLPLGLDWQIGVGIIASFLAREVFVSTMAVVYGLEGQNESDESLKSAFKNHISPLSGLCLLIFFTLSMQCVSTLSAVRRETGSWIWPSVQFSFMTLLAYALAALTYFIGSWP